MYVTTRESLGLLAVRKVRECKKDCGSGKNFLDHGPFFVICLKEAAGSRSYMLQGPLVGKFEGILENQIAHI